MSLARRTVAPWLLRLTAFVLFISGSALAQHYFAPVQPSQVKPAQERRHDTPSVVLLEATRKLEGQAISLDAAPLEVVPFHAPVFAVIFATSSVLVWFTARVPRAFDALAPPPTR
jgi:hypothetical protein